jgi:hypothetical protein
VTNFSCSSTFRYCAWIEFFWGGLTMSVVGTWFFNTVASKLVINNVSNDPHKFDFNMMNRINSVGWIAAPTGLYVLLCKCLLNNKLTFIQMFYCDVGSGRKKYSCERFEICWKIPNRWQVIKMIRSSTHQQVYFRRKRNKAYADNG